jgi:hypothetical protein
MRILLLRRTYIAEDKKRAREAKRDRDEPGVNCIVRLMVLPAATHKTISRYIEPFGREVIPNIG